VIEIEYHGAPDIRDEVLEAVQNDPFTMGARVVTADTVRILCPRGHFIVSVVVTTMDSMPGVLIRPRRRDKQYFGGSIEDENHGFRFDMSGGEWRANPDGSGGYRESSYDGPVSLRVRMHCMKAKCGYDGSFAYTRLAADLELVARRACSGHAEYRLTN
jgi:hypothetical protein